MLSCTRKHANTAHVIRFVFHVLQFVSHRNFHIFYIFISIYTFLFFSLIFFSLQLYVLLLVVCYRYEMFVFGMLHRLMILPYSPIHSECSNWKTILFHPSIKLESKQMENNALHTNATQIDRICCEKKKLRMNRKRHI